MMSWLTSFLVALLSAVVGAFAAGYVAYLAVDWYPISPREGGSGFFILFMGLFGCIAGLVVGLVASRLVAGGASPGFLKALGSAPLVLLGAIAMVGGAARLLADVPPELNGEALMLAVEVRWPEGHTVSPVSDTGEWSLRLSSASGRTVRVSRKGPLWREDAHLVDGRWVVPGAVEVFTSRGDRALDVVPDGVIAGGFIVPLPAFPGTKQLQWSEWMPRARAGAPPLPNGFTYRFRVVPRSQPIRAQAVGPFEVQTIAQSFDEVTYGVGPATYTAYAEFTVRFRGQPVVIEGESKDQDTHRDDDRPTFRYERADAIAVVNGPTPALLVRVRARQRSAHCYLLTAEPDRVRIDYVGYCGSGLTASPLTSDPAEFKLAIGIHPPAGPREKTYVRFRIVGRFEKSATIVSTVSTGRRLLCARRSSTFWSRSSRPCDFWRRRALLHTRCASTVAL